MTPSNSIMSSLAMRCSVTRRGGRSRPVPPSSRFQIGRRAFAAARVALDVEADLLALVQVADARALDGRDVHEHVLAAIIRLDEAEALLGVKPFYGADRHSVVFHVASGAAGRNRAADRTSMKGRKAGPALCGAKAACRGPATSR